MRTVPIVLILVAGALAGRPSSAQEPFSRVSVSAGGAQNVNRNVFHDYWEPGYGGELVVATPFYLGEAELGVALHRYDVVDPAVPAFDAVLTFLGWGIDLSPVNVISWFNGLRVGNYRMAFDEETFQGVRNESELTLGLQSRIDLHVNRAVGFYVAGRFLRTYTSPRFDTAYVSGGLTLSFDAPGWLRTILR